MSVVPPSKLWWKEPLHKEEKIWMILAGIFILGAANAMMPAWHLIGEQNPSSEAYKISPEKFRVLQNEFIAKYKAGSESGVPVVRPPPGSDVYLAGQQFMWSPILVLKKGETYRLHVYSYDVNHGLSIYPMSMNMQVPPNYVWVLKVTPTEKGEYNLLCNEYCGLGHHMMLGKLYVE